MNDLPQEAASCFPSSIPGIQVSSFRPVLTTKEEVDCAFQKIQNMNCRTVQLQWIDLSVPVDFISDSLRKHDLISVSVQEIYETFLKNKEYYLDLCLKTGSSWLCVSRIPKERKTPSALPAFFDELRELMQELKMQGMKLCFHPVSADYEPIQMTRVTKNGVDSLTSTPGADDSLDPIHAMMEALPEMELCLDLYHCLRCGIDVPQMLKKYEGRICMVHFKESQKIKIPQENGSVQEKEVLVPVGSGDTDWSDILKVCLSTHIPYAFAEQETWEGDPFDALKKSFSFLSSCLTAPSDHTDGIKI